jgi:hypothetical protein
MAQRSTVGSFINAWSFFYAPSAYRDLLAQWQDVVSAAESPIAGKGAGIAVLPNQSHTSAKSKQPEFCHPIDFLPAQHLGEFVEARR